MRSWPSPRWCESSPSLSARSSAICATPSAPWSGCSCGAQSDGLAMRARRPRPAGLERPTVSRPPLSPEDPPADRPYVLRLYVTGMTPRSTHALAVIRGILEEHLRGRYDLEVIDIYQHPALTRDEQIVAVPTLVKKLPAPVRRFIGDLSHTERVLGCLDLPTDSRSPSAPGTDPGRPR